MSKMKRAVAMALAAAMVMGSTLTVSAADTGSGSTSGKGENEGHVDTELINVVLPTVPATDGSPFEYVTDPERLIQATAGARYEDYKFPAVDTDTGVYFLVGEKEFANTSETLKVINKSSCDVTITVTAKATASAGGKDLALATSSTTTADNPLYLNLKVGQTDQTISAADAEVKKTIAGNQDNFEVKYTDGGYGYVAKDSAYSWKALELSLSGSVYKGTVAADTTAPTVDVTWGFEKAGESDTVSDADQVVYEESAAPELVSVSDYIKADPHDIVIKFSLGKGAEAVDANGISLFYGADKTAVNTAKYTVDMTNKTVTIDGTVGWLTKATVDIPIVVSLTKGTTAVKNMKGTIAVKDDYDRAEPEIISITDYEKAAQNSVVITFSLGEGDLAVEADGVTLYYSADKKVVNTAKYTVDMAAKTVTVDGTIGWLTGATADIPIYVVLTKGGGEVKELVGTITVK